MEIPPLKLVFLLLKPSLNQAGKNNKTQHVKTMVKMQRAPGGNSAVSNVCVFHCPEVDVNSFPPVHVGWMCHTVLAHVSSVVCLLSHGGGGRTFYIGLVVA